MITSVDIVMPGTGKRIPVDIVLANDHDIDDPLVLSGNYIKCKSECKPGSYPNGNREFRYGFIGTVAELKRDLNDLDAVLLFSEEQTLGDDYKPPAYYRTDD